MDFLRSLREDETLHLDPALDPSVSVHGLRPDSMGLRGNLIRNFCPAVVEAHMDNPRICRRQKASISMLREPRHSRVYLHGQRELLESQTDFEIRPLERLGSTCRTRQLASRTLPPYQRLVARFILAHLV